MNKTQILLLTLAIIASYASANLTLTPNLTVLSERGGNVAFNAITSTGYAPFFFNFYKNGNLAASFQSNVNYYDWVTPIHSSASFFAEGSGTWNGTYAYNTSSTVQITVNAIPVLHLFPTSTTINIFSNITFTNSISGGSAPYNFSKYTVVGGRYSIVNNTITFDGTGLYQVSLTATDNQSMNSTATSTINVAYLPTVNSIGNCAEIYNLSPTERFSFTVNGVTMQGVENYITPDYAAVTLNNVNLLNLYPNEVIPFNNDEYGVEVMNLSWAPILHTISIQICPYTAPITTSTTTIASTTTTSPTTSIVSTVATTMLTTSLPTTSTTSLTTSSSTTTTLLANPGGVIDISKEGQANPYGIFALAMVIIVVIAYIIYRKIVR